MGSTFLRNFYTVWDNENSEISFTIRRDIEAEPIELSDVPYFEYN